METGWAELGQVIRAHRLKAGFSQEKLAQLSGSHFTYISEIETNRRNPSIGVLRRLAAALDVKLSALIKEAEEMSNR